MREFLSLAGIFWGEGLMPRRGVGKWKRTRDCYNPASFVKCMEKSYLTLCAPSEIFTSYTLQS